NITLHELGWYYVEATHESGCKTLDSFEVILNDIHPTILVRPLDTLNCRNLSVNASFESSLPNTTYQVFMNNIPIANGTTAEITEPGEYVVVGTAANACKDTQSFVVYIDTLHPDLAVLPYDTITCEKDSATLMAVSGTPGSDFSWDATIQNPLVVRAGGTHRVKAILAHNGCETEVTVEVVEDKLYAFYNV